MHTTSIHFDPSHSATVCQVNGDGPPHQIIDALALPPPRGLIILNGGTAPSEEGDGSLARLIADGVAGAASEGALTLVTGGTDAGIFRLLGQGFEVWPRTAPCVGVAVARLVCWPGRPRGDTPLEPHHSHFVLVDGDNWGDETALMFALAAELARECPSLAVFAGGGEVTLREMEATEAAGRPMVLIAGSGRAVDAVLAARAGGQDDDPRLAAIARNGIIIPFALEDPPEALRVMLRSKMAEEHLL